MGISEHLKTIRLVLANNQMATVLCAYAPTLDSEEKIKETFYACLDDTLAKIPKEDKIILLGDFNCQGWPGPTHLEGHHRKRVHWEDQLQQSSASKQMCSI